MSKVLWNDEHYAKTVAHIKNEKLPWTQLETEIAEISLSESMKARGSEDRMNLKGIPF